ncbi:MAG: hypothetical protein ACJAVV_001820 [Alphaproteobacteria bacterium]|jgi:hypothetical protein
MHPLSFYAGKTAMSRIQSEGLKPEMFSAFLGASGGPKWFVLAGLDKVIFNEFMHKSTRHVDIIGSSAGAFRATCFAQSDPKAAITRLADRYSTVVYSDKPSVKEITHKGIELLDYMVGDKGVKEALNSTSKSLHIIVARCHGLTASEQKLIQFAGLAIAAGRNAISRKKLAKSFTRVIFSSHKKGLVFSEKIPIETEHGLLNQENFLDCLMASGSIPAVIEGVKDIAGVPQGMFRDGGILDYHFDMKINTPDLVLYPHFYAKPTPGWFDKSLKSRSCHPDSYDNVVLLAPSEEFVAQLPHGKIPDRKDFSEMPAQERIAYWTRVIKESDRLAEHFLNVVEHSDPAQFIKAINLQR